MAFGIAIAVLGLALMLGDIADTLRRIEKKMDKRKDV